MQHKLLLAPVLATLALAAQADTFIDTARVRSAFPQYENISIPRQVCTMSWVNESQRLQGERSYGGAVIGGVAGAVLGNQVGNGHGREAATALGAVVGAFILGILDNMLSLNNVSSNIQLVVKGLLIIGAVGLQQFRPRAVE